MISTLLALLTIYAGWAPQSLIGRALGSAVDALCRRMAATRLTTVVCALLAITASAGLIAYAGFEGVWMTAMAAPGTFVVFMTIDVGLAVEVLIFGWLAASGVLRGVKAVILTRLPRRGARRASRSAGPRRTPPAANDEEPAPAPALPLAA